MNNLRSFIATLLTVFLIVSPFQFSVSQVNAATSSQVAQSESVSIQTNLENNQVTKVDKFTFDVWVRDAKNNKIDTKYVTITNNGKNVPINWNDDEKTSYTVDLDVGENNIKIAVNHPNGKTTDSYTIYREEAQDGDVIGSITFSMDAFTIGIGYIIEPIKVDLIKGERASELLVRTLNEYGYDYEHTGFIDRSFYLAALVADKTQIYKVKPSIPEVLKEALGGNYNEDGYWDDYLGEFDFNSLSGWMYAVNNVFPNVGYADYYLQDEDVMRTQFTLALGSDIGGGWGNNFFELVNKDALTKQVAEINTYHRDDYLKNQRIKEAYENSLSVLQKVNASQKEIDDALENLKNAEQDYLDLPLAKEVNNQIEALPLEKVIKLSDGKKVSSVRKAYETLTQNQKKLVTNIKKLEALENRLENLKKEAENVTTFIDVLSSEANITIDDKDKVKKARQAYEDLTREQQKLVTNVEKLTSLESQIEVLEKEARDKEAANEVSSMIDALPSKSGLTLSDKSKVEEVRQAYDSLTKNQQKLVLNLEKLTTLESRIEVLEKEAVDNEIAKEVSTMIDGLPSETKLTLSDKSKVENVRRAYESLTKEQKNLIPNLKKLTALETGIVALEKEAAEQAKNQQVANEVIAHIDALPTKADVTLADKSKVENAQKAYDNLMKAQQKLVTNLEKLTALESQIVALEKEAADKQAAKEVLSTIDALPTKADVTLADKFKVENARNAFDNLTKAQQKLVTNLEKLTALESRIVVLENEVAEDEVNKYAANKVTTIINALPKEVNITLEDKNLVEKARQAYESLTKAQQSLVSDVSKLELLENRLEVLEKEADERSANQQIADKVAKEITALPAEDSIRLDDKIKVEKVRNAYEKLRDSQKKLVSNVSKLESLENRLNILEKEVAEHEENVQAAEKVSALIEALPSVEQVQIADLTKVEEAQDAYYALSEDAQQLVTNHLHVVMLEQKIMQLTEDAAYEEQKSLLKAEIAEVLKTDLRKIKNESARSLGISVGVAEDVLRKAKQNVQLYTTLFSSRQQLFTTHQSQSVQALTDAYEQLKDAVEKVEYKDETNEETVVLSHLIFEVERLKTVTLTEVPEEKVQVIQEKISRTEIILEKEEVTQEEIDVIVEEVQKEIEELNTVLDKPTVDKSSLATVIEYANNLDISNKPLTLQEELTIALSEAIAVLENEEATTEDVEKALMKLQLSIEQIEAESDNESDEESDNESDEESDNESDEESNNESDEESDNESDEESDNESDEESDNELDEESDNESDEESDNESDEESDNESDEESDNESNKESSNKTDTESDNKLGTESNETTTTEKSDRQTNSDSNIKKNNHLQSSQGETQDNGVNQNTLPKTATPIYSLMFIGLMLLFLGFSYLVFQHVVRRKTV